MVCPEASTEAIERSRPPPAAGTYAAPPSRFGWTRRLDPSNTRTRVRTRAFAAATTPVGAVPGPRSLTRTAKPAPAVNVAGGLHAVPTSPLARTPRLDT